MPPVRDCTDRWPRQQDVADPVQPSHQDAAHEAARPDGAFIKRQNAERRSAATSGAASTSAGSVRGVGTMTPRAPAARAASTSAPMSPMYAASAVVIPNRRHAPQIMKGAG